MLEVEELEVLLEASVFRVPMQIFMLWGHRDPVMADNLHNNRHPDRT